MSGEQNLNLVRQIEANREFLLTILSQNPALLEPLPPAPSTSPGDCPDLL